MKTEYDRFLSEMKASEKYWRLCQVIIEAAAARIYIGGL